MNNKAMIGLMLAGTLGIAGADMSSAIAQSTLGGAKTPQNKIGGVAKPAPVIGGATVHSYSPPAPPKPVIGMAKPGSPGPVTPGISGATGNAMASGQISGPPKQTPPVTAPNKGKPVVTAASTPKCASGTCPPKVPKP